MILGQSIHIPNNAIVVTVLQLFNTDAEFYRPVAGSSGKVADTAEKQRKSSGYRRIVPDSAGYRRIVPDNRTITNDCGQLRTIANDCERLKTVTNDCGRLRTIDKASQKPVLHLLKSKQGGNNA